MRIRLYFGLVIGFTIPSVSLLPAQIAEPGISQLDSSSKNLGGIPRSARVGASKAVGNSDALQRKAETIAQKASILEKSQTSRNLTTAVALFRESGRLFEAAHSPEKAADAYFEAAEIYFVFSQYDKARQLYGNALKLGQNPEIQCRALSREARTYATTGVLSLADSMSKRALDLCQPLSEKAQAEALEARGEALESAGDYSKSAECFGRARELFALANDVNGQAQSLLMLSVALFSDGKQAEGIEAAGQALQLWSSADDHYGVGRVRSALGIFAITRGEFETAQCNYKLSEPILRAVGNRDDQASVLNGLGYASRETGDWQKSLEYYQKARRIFASVQDLPGEHESITGMGRALLKMKEYEQLLPLYEKELRLARGAGDPVLVASSLADMAAVYEAEGRYAKAETLYHRSLETYVAANHLYGEGDILISLGHLQASRGKYSDALTSLERANALKEKMGQIEEVARIKYEMASIYQRLNRMGEATAAIERAIEIIETQRGSLSHVDLRASYFASVHRYYALYIQLLMTLDRRDPGLDFAKKAFEASEKSKVRSLLDLLTTSAQVAPCGDLLQRQLHPENSPDMTAAVSNLEDDSPAPTLAVRQVQADIEGDDTILLEYALGEHESYVWAIDQHQIASFALPKSERIRKLVELLREKLVPPQLGNGESASDYQIRVRQNDRAYEVAARQLSQILLGPVNLARARRVLIVPDGSLQYVPFAALPLPGPGVVEGHLIDRYEVDILPSASVLGTLRRAMASRASPTASVAVFADPVFEKDDPRVSLHLVPREKSVQERPRALTRAIRDTGASEYIPRLLASRDEANTIAAIFRSREPNTVHLALDFDANRDYVLKDGLTKFRVVHFATHGVLDARRPEMSGLILSLIDVNGRKQDGYLRVGDIYKLKLSADLIVLSSCDSALGKDLESEGIIGLPRAFLYAGAKGVIASLWKVNDEATARLMSALYVRIRRGESSGAALRGAQLELSHDEHWSKPYYWAAFALQGDYK